MGNDKKRQKKRLNNFGPYQDFVKKDLSSSEFSYINDLLKTADIKKNLFVFEINSKKKIVLVSIKNNLKTPDIESLGAELYGHIKHKKERNT